MRASSNFTINKLLFVPKLSKWEEAKIKDCPFTRIHKQRDKIKPLLPSPASRPKDYFFTKNQEKDKFIWRHWKLQISRTEKLKKKRKKEIKSDIEKKIKLHARQHTTIRLLLGWWCGRHWAYDVIIEHRPQVEKDKGDDWWEWVKYLGREGCWLSPG